MPMRNLLTALLLLLAGLINGNALAVESPQQVVEDVTNRMTQALQQNHQALRADPSKIYGLVNQIALPRFDFELISQWVLGKYWREATPEQRRQFSDEFRTLLVRSYAGALLEYSGEKITFPPGKATVNADDATVHASVQPKSGSPIDISYSLRLRNGAWKVYDVAVNGVSLVINYRSTFANQIRNSGMDAVIRDLKERNAKGTT